MHRYLFCSMMAAVLLYACSANDNADDPVVNREPYKKITDSIQLSPNNAELYYHRGSLFYSNNQMVHAEKDLRKAWELQPTEEHALSLTTVLKQKNQDSAISFLKTALQKMPESIALNIGLARGYQAKGDTGEALRICDAVLQLYPNQLDALLLKSDLLGSMDRPKESLAVLETAMRYAPGDKDIAYDLAYAYAEQKNSNALRLTDQLLRSDSTESAARAYYIKALYYQNTGAKAEALKNYDAAARINYNFLDAYLDKGIYLYELKNYDAAMKSFQLGQRISPATADFFYWIAKTQEATGNKEEAKLNYQRAYSLDKTMVEARKAASRL